MSEVFGSINNIIKVRELLVLTFADLFKSRVDYRFLGNDEKGGTIFFFDEGTGDIEQPDKYPRLVFVRAGSKFGDIGGFNQLAQQNDIASEEIVRSDIFVHRFVIRCIASNKMFAEALAYISSLFVHFLSSEIEIYNKERPVHLVKHDGMGNVFPLEGDSADKGLWECDVSCSVADFESMRIKNNSCGGEYQGVDIEIEMSETAC